MADVTLDVVRPFVVKVGGSLVETGRLKAALARIAAARVPIVIVPGGGPFADGVRNLQAAMQFSDAVAHRLAMLAMQQMAEFFISLQARLQLAHDLDDIADVLRRGDVPVWGPLQMLANDTSVPSDWSATSDALAARLAELLGGARLLLLKSVGVEKEASADELARRGVVDPVFPAIVARAGLSWSIFGPQDDALFAAVLDGQGGS